VPQHVVEEMKASCSRFFQQPWELRNMYRSQSFEDPVAYSTSFNPGKEKANDWKDVLYVRDFPENLVDGFSIAPGICRFLLLSFSLPFSVFFAFFLVPAFSDAVFLKAFRSGCYDETEVDFKVSDFFAALAQ
jgi:hypothetical protein